MGLPDSQLLCHQCRARAAGDAASDGCSYFTPWAMARLAGDMPSEADSHPSHQRALGDRFRHQDLGRAGARRQGLLWKAATVAGGWSQNLIAARHQRTVEATPPRTTPPRASPAPHRLRLSEKSEGFHVRLSEGSGLTESADSESRRTKSMCRWRMCETTRIKFTVSAPGLTARCTAARVPVGRSPRGVLPLYSL